jgi:hypothetical protein
LEKVEPNLNKFQPLEKVEPNRKQNFNNYLKYYCDLAQPFSKVEKVEKVELKN